MDEKRKALFIKLLNHKLSDVKCEYKEWCELTFKEIGILDNLLSNYMNDNLWQIILDYLQIPLPKCLVIPDFSVLRKYMIFNCDYCNNGPYSYNDNERYVSCVGASSVVSCVKYDNNLPNIAKTKKSYFDFRIGEYGIYNAICESCLYNNDYMDENTKKYCNNLPSGFITNKKIDEKYFNMFLWLGLIDFENIYVQKKLHCTN